MHFTKANFFTGLLITGSSAFLLNCSAASTSATAGGGGGGGSGLSDFAASMAEDLVLTSPTAQRATGSIFSSGPQYTLKGDVLIMAGPNADDSPKEKKEALEALLADEAPITCNISLNIQNAGRANCYGPNVDYTNHEFDGTSDGQFPGGDLGIWEATEAGSGEACAAAQLNQQMKGVISYVDAAQFIAGGISCVANKSGRTLPAAASTSIALTADMANTITINSTTLAITEASISREADDGSNPVYVTTLTGTLGTKTVSIRVKHISTAGDDSTNKGKISIKVTDTAGPGSTEGASLEYEKTSSSSAKFLLKSINFNNSAVADPFTSGSNYSVDLNKAWTGNANYFLAEINPTNFTGTFAYAWQAGNGDSHSRTFNAKLTESGGNVTGTAFFGFGPTMQTGPGAIDGMICNWAGPGNNHNNAAALALVQRQDMSLSSGKFIVSGTSYITFDPVESCESNSATMSLQLGANPSYTMDTTTMNLRPDTEVSSVITLPTAPTNVD